MKKFLILSMLGLLLAGCIVEPGYRGGYYGGGHGTYYQPRDGYSHW